MKKETYQNIKEKVLSWQIYHAKTLKYIGIIVSCLLGLFLLINLGLYFKNILANMVGTGATIGNAKRIASIIGVIIFVVVLVKNIISKSFNITKFFGGFNIFAGPVQGKLLYYGIIFALVSAVSLGIYHRFTQETIETNNRNIIHRAETVTIDQRTITNTATEDLLIGIKIFGFNLGITHHSKPKVEVNNTNNSKPRKK